jgi:hypothetical protein
MAGKQPFDLIYDPEVFRHLEAAERRVRILAIAVKVRNRILIAGEEVEL